MLKSKDIFAFAAFTLVMSFLTCGCNISPPGGAPVQPITLGTVTDEINRMQEENAEFAKLIIYMHEFEINEQPQFPGATLMKKPNPSLNLNYPNEFTVFA